MVLALFKISIKIIMILKFNVYILKTTNKESNLGNKVIKQIIINLRQINEQYKVGCEK